MINILVKVKNVMNKILSAASVVLLVFMTSLVLWQVFTRYVLGKPAAFTEELVKYSLMWTAFIGAAYAFFTRDHMSLTIIKDKLTGNKRKILLLVIDVIILLLAVFLLPDCLKEINAACIAHENDTDGKTSARKKC